MTTAVRKFSSGIVITSASLHESLITLAAATVTGRRRSASASAPCLILWAVESRSLRQCAIRSRSRYSLTTRAFLKAGPRSDHRFDLLRIAGGSSLMFYQPYSPSYTHTLPPARPFSAALRYSSALRSRRLSTSSFSLPRECPARARSLKTVSMASNQHHALALCAPSKPPSYLAQSVGFATKSETTLSSERSLCRKVPG